MRLNIERKTMDANQIIDNVFAITQRSYLADDEMRWPYRVGMLEGKIRELVYLLNDQTQQIDSLTAELERVKRELSTMV